MCVELRSNVGDRALQRREQSARINLDILVDQQTADQPGRQLWLELKDLARRHTLRPEVALRPLVMQQLKLLIFVGVSRHPERTVHPVTSAHPADRLDLGDELRISTQAVQLERQDVILLAQRQRSRPEQSGGHAAGLLAGLVAFDDNHLLTLACQFECAGETNHPTTEYGNIPHLTHPATSSIRCCWSNRSSPKASTSGGTRPFTMISPIQCAVLAASRMPPR